MPMPSEAAHHFHEFQNEEVPGRSSDAAAATNDHRLLLRITARARKPNTSRTFVNVICSPTKRSNSQELRTASAVRVSA